MTDMEKFYDDLIIINLYRNDYRNDSYGSRKVKNKTNQRKVTLKLFQTVCIWITNICFVTNK